jgi:hypothetical protein
LQSPEDEQVLLVMLASADTFSPLLQSPEDEQVLLVMFAVVHLFAMSSACANPVLYGFLNENFKQVTGNFSYSIFSICDIFIHG